jgi:choline dehydrogenase
MATQPNLTVQTDAHTRRILWDEEVESGAAPKAVGVEFSMSDGSIGHAMANKEVILAAGSIASPMLLQVSGVGPPELLDELGVPLVHASPGVGGNLQDHLEVYQSYEVLGPHSLASHLSLVGKGTLGARWLVTKEGLGATNHFETVHTSTA